MTAVLALGCAVPVAPPPTAAARPQVLPANLQSRALLLLMSDRRQFDPFSVEAVRGDNPELWPELAIALGRIGDPRGVPVLEGLLRDERVEVRRSAAFALGLLGDTAARSELLLAVSDPDRETGRRAVEALARLETPLVRVVEAVLAVPPDERWERLLPELFRYEPADVVTLGTEAMSSASSEQQVWAIYALGRQAVPEGREQLRVGLLHPDPWARGWAARGLGTVGEGEDIEQLRPLLGDAAPGPVIQALRAGGQMIADGRTAAPASWVAVLRRLFDDPRLGVRLTAIEQASHWLLEPRLGEELLRRAREARGRERELALLALAGGGDPRVEDLTAVVAASTDSRLRALAATAAGRAGLQRLLARLEQDAVPAVRLAALAARLEPGDAELAVFARRALIDPDPAVRAAAVSWLAENPVAPMDELAVAIQGNDSRRMIDLRLDGVSALAARASAEPLERGAIVALLEILSRDEEYLVRRAAADSLGELGRPRPIPEPVQTGHGLARYRDRAQLALEQPRVALETAQGSLEMELDCEAAPLTCLSFLQLVNQGFFDGLSFHRVVPDFVVQAGDPRGDGWGGPGFTLRDEPNLLRYERGVLGMARSASDTAGSQFFIALSAQHHLDGAYTAFGRVVAGDEVLDRIAQGDLIVRATEIRFEP